MSRDQASSLLKSAQRGAQDYRRGDLPLHQLSSELKGYAAALSQIPGAEALARQLLEQRNEIEVVNAFQLESRKGTISDSDAAVLAAALDAIDALGGGFQR